MKPETCWPDALLFNRSTFMKGWSGQKHGSLYDELLDHYFDHPAEIQKMLETKDTSFLWLSPTWFHSPKPLPSSSRGQVYLAQCKLPWKKSKINVAIRAVHDITRQVKKKKDKISRCLFTLCIVLETRCGCDSDTIELYKISFARFSFPCCRCNT